MHSACAPPPPVIGWTGAPCHGCGQTRHAPEVQELINLRGGAKVRAAMAGNTAELDRLAGLPSSCTQTLEEWHESTYQQAIEMAGA